jgi:hypothetical protein
MANSDKDILITPNTGTASRPNMRFTGANNTPLNLYTQDAGTVVFEGTVGQLFSVADGLTGTIFSVNDVNGIPSIEVIDTGEVRLARLSGNVGIGGSGASTKLQVFGNISARTASNGYVTLETGNAANTGWVGVYNSAGTRQGYMGFASLTGTTGTMNIWSESAINGLAFGTAGLQRMLIDKTGTLQIGQVFENATVAAIAANTTVNYELLTNRAVTFYTTAATANWTLNIRGNATTTLDSLMAVGQSLTIAFLVTNGATPYRQTALQIDGTATGVTTRWLFGTAPSAGNANSIDAYTVTVIKTGVATYTVLESLVRYA